jgi:hypothetical protein
MSVKIEIKRGSLRGSIAFANDVTRPLRNARYGNFATWDFSFLSNIPFSIFVRHLHLPEAVAFNSAAFALRLQVIL